MEIQISILEISPRLKYLKVESFDTYSIVFIGDNIIKKIYDLEKAILNKELIVLQLKEYNPSQLISFILIRNKINIVGLGELNVINQIKWFSIKELKEILTLDKYNESVTNKNIIKNNCNHKPDIMNIFKTINNINSVNNNANINNIVNKENDINILNINNIKIKLKITINKDNKKKVPIDHVYIKKNSLVNKKKGKLSLLSLININNNNQIQTSKIRTLDFNNFIDGENNENNNHNNNENINFYNFKSSSQKILKNSFYKSQISNIWDVSNEISNSKSIQTVGNTKLIIKNNNSKRKYNCSNKTFCNKSKKKMSHNFFKLYTINNDDQNKFNIKNLYQKKEKDIHYNVKTFNFNEKSKKDLFFTVESNEEILRKSKHKLNNQKKINSCHNSKNHYNKNKIYNNNSLKNLKKAKNHISNINTYTNKGKSMYNKMAYNLQIMHNSNKDNSSNNLKSQTLFEYRSDLKSSKSSKLLFHNKNSKEDKAQKVKSKIGKKHSLVVEKFRTLELSLKKNIFVLKDNINNEDNDDSTINYYEKIKNDFISFYNDDYIKLIKGNFSQFELNLFIEKIIELYKAYKMKYNSLYSNFLEYKKFFLFYQYKFLCLSKKYNKLHNNIISLESAKNKLEINRNELNDFLFKTNKIFGSGEFNQIFENLYNLNDLIFNKDYNNNSNKNEIKKKKLFFIFEEICEKNEKNLNSLAKKYYHDLKKCVIFNNQLSEIRIPNYDNDSNN